MDTVDRIAPQWLGMAVLNVISTIYLFKNYKSLSPSINRHFKSLITVLYCLFIIWAGLSFFYAINEIEVLVNLSRHFSVFLMLTVMSVFVSRLKNKENILSYVLVIFLLIESIAVINDVIAMLSSSGTINSGLLKGVTANRNITAFSIALKIPFLLYLSFFASSTKLRFVLGSILTISILNILLIQSRASYIALFLIISAYLIQVILIFKGSINQKLKKIAFIIFPLIITFSINQIYFANKGADALSRASTISLSTNDGSVNQ